MFSQASIKISLYFIERLIYEPDLGENPYAFLTLWVLSLLFKTYLGRDAGDSSEFKIKIFSLRALIWVFSVRPHVTFRTIFQLRKYNKQTSTRFQAGLQQYLNLYFVEKEDNESVRVVLSAADFRFYSSFYYLCLFTYSFSYLFPLFLFPPLTSVFSFVFPCLFLLNLPFFDYTAPKATFFFSDSYSDNQVNIYVL
jgi:hypothetical protein